MPSRAGRVRGVAQASSSAIERPVMPHLVRRLLRGPCSWAGPLRCREIRGKPAAVPPGRCGMGGAFALLVSPVGVVPGPAGRHGPPQLVHNDHRQRNQAGAQGSSSRHACSCLLRRPAGTPATPPRTDWSPPSCNEIQRLPIALVAQPLHGITLRLRWSAWRRRHRSHASHYRPTSRIKNMKITIYSWSTRRRSALGQ